MTRPTAAQQTLDREDAIVRATELIADIRRLVKKAKPRTDATYRNKLALLLGGPGSGNFGHAGRPGEIGGSASDMAGEGGGGGGGGKPPAVFLAKFDPKDKATWYRQSDGWHTSPEGESPYGWRDDIPKDYEPPNTSQHKILRTANSDMWGGSHSGSSLITGAAAKQMGIEGYLYEDYEDEPTDVRASAKLSTQMLEAIAKDEKGAEETLYHSFENVRGTVFKPGDTMKLPLTATAGKPETSFATRLEHESQKGAPTVFVFPKGTKMMAYQKWPTRPGQRNYEDGNAKDFGHVYSEAIVAGQFRVLKVETVYMGSQHSAHGIKPGETPQLYGQVVHLEPIGYFDPATGQWKEQHG